MLFMYHKFLLTSEYLTVFLEEWVAFDFLTVLLICRKLYHELVLLYTHQAWDLFNYVLQRRERFNYKFRWVTN